MLYANRQTAGFLHKILCSVSKNQGNTFSVAVPPNYLDVPESRKATLFAEK